MQISYYSDKLRKNYEDEEFLTKKFGKDICKKFVEFLEHILFSKNLQEAQNTKAGLKIEKLKGMIIFGMLDWIKNIELILNVII